MPGIGATFQWLLGFHANIMLLRIDVLLQEWKIIMVLGIIDSPTWGRKLYLLNLSSTCQPQTWAPT